MTRTITIDRPAVAHVEAARLLDQRQDPGTLLPTRVDSLLATARQIQTDLDPQDVDRPLSEGFFRYHDGKAAFAWRNTDGSFEAPQSFTRRGLRQLGYRVLGGGGTKYMGTLANSGTHGRKLAEVNWNFGMQSQTRPTLLRSVQLPGQKYRTIRASLSGGGRGYSVLDNIDLIELLADSPELRDLPIISSRIDADSMRIRGLLNPEDAALFDPTTGKARNPGNAHICGLNIPVAMWEIGNGEVGNGSSWIDSGIYWIGCLNGLGSYSSGAGWRWNHSGGADRAERVKSGIIGAIKSMRIQASGQIADYKAATEVAIDDAFGLLDAWGDNDLTDAQRDRAKGAMIDPTSCPNSKLATIIDGVTLAAQRESDPSRQRDMEKFAARLLQKGIEMARQSGGRIEMASAA